jgi:2-iminobutanoate/2-iminopropanoate deaminase
LRKWKIITEGAPAAIGPYSQAIRAGDLIFVSGQLPIDPDTGEMISEIGRATRRIFANIEAVLLAGDSTMSDIVKLTVYLTDLSDFEEVNGVFKEFFTSEPPARETVQVAGLPKGSRLEISAVAVAGGEGRQ